MSQITNFAEAERLLDRGQLQALAERGWCDLRRNGTTKRWKRNYGRASIPVKMGFRNAFRLEFDDARGGCGINLRARPDSES